MGSRSGVPQPPYSVELLADLHAGELPENVATELWPLVRADDDAMRTIAALDRVAAQLGDLGRDASVGTTIPDDVAARMEAAIARQPSPTSVSSLTSHPRFVNRRRWALGAGAAVAAAVAVVFAVVVLREPTPSGSVEAQPTSTVAPVDLGDELAPTALTLLGRQDVPSVLAGNLSECLAANGLNPAAKPLGAAPVTFRGQDAVLLLVGGPTPPTVTAVVVGTGCKADDPQLRARSDIG
ncbi:hypothetical protein ACHIPZ_24590 [Antrihabitans sp. NCIMB 15449]|uniref:Anti-sigma-M factor RsmA n=1 Tax=Antrihabitans spumae TaxID=3373370 RepID=A0ABW7JU51_9NOCA